MVYLKNTNVFTGIQEYFEEEFTTQIQKLNNVDKNNNKFKKSIKDINFLKLQKTSKNSFYDYLE
jgi:virulence-associated protein VapD